MRHSLMLRKRKTFVAVFVAPALLSLLTGGCGPGFLGLEDFERDILFSLGGGLAGALLVGALPGDEAATQDQPGEQGPVGPQGPAGPPIFSVFVDAFFGGEFADDLSVLPVRNEDPTFGDSGTPVGYSVSIPANFEALNPINMRLLLFRSGPCDRSCLVLSVDARRFRLGASEAECIGGEAADCSDGTRRVVLDEICTATDGSDLEQFIVVDLPLSESGLDYGEILPGDLLAFELNTVQHDGGDYNLLGV